MNITDVINKHGNDEISIDGYYHKGFIDEVTYKHGEWRAFAIMGKNFTPNLTNKWIIGERAYFVVAFSTFRHHNKIHHHEIVLTGIGTFHKSLIVFDVGLSYAKCKVGYENSIILETKEFSLISDKKVKWSDGMNVDANGITHLIQMEYRKDIVIGQVIKIGINFYKVEMLENMNESDVVLRLGVILYGDTVKEI